MGTQYRSAVFYHSEKQKETAEKVIEELEEKKIFENKIVTEITAAKDFYIAEKEHQDFYNQHRQQPYCQFIIDPKINNTPIINIIINFFWSFILGKRSDDESLCFKQLIIT